MSLFGDIPSWLGFREDQKVRKAAEAREQERDLREQERIRQEQDLARQQWEEQKAEQRRSEAARVFATLSKRIDDPEDPQKQYTLGIHFRNNSPAPVHDVQVVATFGVADKPFTTVRAVVQPGEVFIAKKKPWERGSFAFELPALVTSDSGELQPYGGGDRFRVLRCVFRDCNGVWWNNDDQGLTQIPPLTTPLKSRGEDGWKPKPKSAGATKAKADNPITPKPAATVEPDGSSSTPTAHPYVPANPFAAAQESAADSASTKSSFAATPTPGVAVTQPAGPTAAASSSKSEQPKPLFDALKDWRTFRYRADGVKAYEVATNKDLEAIAEKKPTTVDELRYIPGIGKAKCEKYGEEILKVVKRNR